MCGMLLPETAGEEDNYGRRQLDWLSVNESFARGDIDWVLGKFSSLE